VANARPYVCDEHWMRQGERSYILWGLIPDCEFDPRALGGRLGHVGDLILAGEPIEDRSVANLVIDEVDHVWWLGSAWAGASCARARVSQGSLD
jgi:hypothetical protein